MLDKPKRSFLLVANWDSNVGYAWWLMESFWVAIAQHYMGKFSVLLAYPSISTIPNTIGNAPITTKEQAFKDRGLASLWMECKFLVKNKVGAIYFSDRPAASLRYLAYRLCGVRFIIVHDHTPGIRTPPEGLKKILKQILQRTPLITADGLIGASDYVYQRLRDIVCAPTSKCYSAPNGLPISHMPPPPMSSLRNEFNLHDKYPIAVMTGRASHYKNVGLVLEAIAELKQRGHSVYFLFCGDGPDLKDFQAMAQQLGINDRVVFAGRRTDIPQLLKQCDFAIHPSSGEVGYSLSILEYMQAKLPVIVPDNPSVCGATNHRDTGLIYKNNDKTDLANSILELLKDPAGKTRMGENAARLVLEKYNLDNTHIALLSALDNIMSIKNSAGSQST